MFALSGAFAAPPHHSFRLDLSRGGGASARPCPTPISRTPGGASAPSCGPPCRTTTWQHLARAAEARRLDGGDAGRRGARRRAAPGSATASAGCCRPCAEARARARTRGRARRARAPRRRRRARDRARRRPPTPLQPAPHVRPVRDRRLQPARPRRRAGGRRDARRSPTTRCSSAARPGSARPTCCTRSPTTSASLRRRADRPLHDGRGVHQPLRRRAPRRRHRGLQGRLPRRRRPARRRRPVPPEQGQDRAGVLPHLQRAARRPAPSSCSPPTACRATSTRSRTGCASASRPASCATSARPTSPRA